MPYLPRKVTGAGVTEADEYDEIFAALKHPVRRQILLFLEEQGEASFTQVQNAVGLETRV
jgi:DNA-binding transcriptional ArsR family regulator